MSGSISREDAIKVVHEYFSEAIYNETTKIDEDGDEVFADMRSVNKLLTHNKTISKALKELPSAEDVSREDYHNLLTALDDVDRALRQYQAKDENQSTDDNWIPVSERLPEQINETQKRGWYLTTNRYGVVSEVCYEFYNEPFGHGWKSDIEIIAWMPLPKPYREENEE